MRSLRIRLAFLFFAITLAAIGVLYLYVVPQLESRLRDEKLSQLTIVAQQTAPQIAAGSGAVNTTRSRACHCWRAIVHAPMWNNG